MLRRIAFLFLILGAAGVLFADHATLFKVRIENVSNSATLRSSAGATAPAALSPGLFILYDGKEKDIVFADGKPDNGAGLEAQAEDGNPEMLSKSLAKKKGVLRVGVFDTPIGAGKPGPILPGGAYEFTFTAHPGTKLVVEDMFGQSNDLFYAPNGAGIALFDDKGEAINGDITNQLVLWDAGTEVNQEPGFGPDQAPRQAAPNTGASEKNAIGPVKDGFAYPATGDVIRVTISHQ